MRRSNPARASTGQLDFAAYTLRTQDIPLLKLGERTGLIKVHIWTRLHASDVAIQPNYNYADQRLRDLYWDVTAWGVYDNRNIGGGDFDYGVSTGIGWDY